MLGGLTPDGALLIHVGKLLSIDKRKEVTPHQSLLGYPLHTLLRRDPWRGKDARNRRGEACIRGDVTALVEFQGKMWLLGGTENYYFGDASSMKNDVWCSEDGAHWEQVTANAGWPARAYHQAAVLDGKIYVFGGGNYVPEYTAFNDVWMSEDGKQWTRVTESAPWHPRLWFSSAVYRGRIESLPLLLGSATPSLESWSHAQSGRYQRLRMTQRIGGVAVFHKFLGPHALAYGFIDFGVVPPKLVTKCAKMFYQFIFNFLTIRII